MQRAHIWRKFHLHRIKIVLLFFSLFLIFTVAQAQQLHSQENFEWDHNLPHYDDRLLHYGFTLGLNSTRFRPVMTTPFFTDTISSIHSKTQGGFNLGFVMNLRLSKYFDARLLPGVAFYTRAVQYQFKSGFTSNQSTESVFIETPLLLKYKSQRRKNHRMYVVGGLKPCFEAGAKKKEKKKSELRTENFDLTIEYGIGIDLYFQFFKFAPELRFSHGLSNLLINDQNLYSQSLTKLTTHTVSLYFFFE
jgi:hypothetical protein